MQGILSAVGRGGENNALRFWNANKPLLKSRHFSMPGAKINEALLSVVFLRCRRRTNAPCNRIPSWQGEMCEMNKSRAFHSVRASLFFLLKMVMIIYSVIKVDLTRSGLSGLSHISRRGEKKGTALQCGIPVWRSRLPAR